MTPKRGLPSQSAFPTVKVEAAPLPIVKVEHSLCPSTDVGVDHLCGQSTAGLGETDSDVASEVDDQYGHAKV